MIALQPAEPMPQSMELREDGTSFFLYECGCCQVRTHRYDETVQYKELTCLCHPKTLADVADEIRELEPEAVT